MNAITLIAILACTYLVVFAQSTVNFVRVWLGAQIDLLPALIVYAALSGNPLLTTLIAVFGGLWFDSLSLNPLGVSIGPLMIMGMVLLHFRELVLREQMSAQFIFGLAAGAAVPVMVVLVLLTLGKQPLLGWGSLWQWAVMSVGCGMATPVVFRVFDLIEHWLSYQPLPETTFNHNREMKRGRH
ncbi:MAG: hypothetical protein K0Q55_1758 [Verrucomicrobia bacterium]|jgi:hypothetical protein|nr:hypothetical protein [Verrucomicrobiota bacterium]